MPEPTLKPWINSDKGYYVRVCFNDGCLPKESRYALGVDTLNEARAAIETFREQRLPAILRDRRPELAQTSTLRDAYTWYFTKYLPDLGRAAKTIDAYDRILHDFTSFCRARHVGRVQQVTADLFREWQAHRAQARKSDSPGAKRDEMLCVRQFFDVCAEEGKLPELTIKWTIPGKTKSRRFRALDDGEVAAIAEALEKDPPKPYLPIRWMFLNTPWLPSDTLDFRQGEFRGDHIDRDRIKTSRQMVYPVTDEMRGIIAEATRGRIMHRTDHVFVTADGDPWEYTQLEKQTRYWQAKHGLDFTFRDLRVTYATRLANTGCPPNILAELMGHENIETTLQYYVRVNLTNMLHWADRVPNKNTVYPVQENAKKTQ